MNERSRRSNTAYTRQEPSRAMMLLLIVLAVALALMAFFCYLIWGNIASEITVEAGTVLDPDSFIIMDWGMSAKLASDEEDINMSRIGDYIVKVRYHGVDFYSKLHVVDTHAPIVTVQDAVVYSDNVPDPSVFIQQVQDGTDVTVTYVKTPDMSVEGTQVVQLCVTDGGGNAVFATAEMNLTPDYEAPRILGVNKFSLYEGGTISYRSGVVLEDNCDEAPVLTIDSSRVDLSKAGSYEVIYRATDAAGNVTTLTAPVTVEEKPDTYVEEAEIIAMADELLATFITKQMTTEEQVEAVYDWVRSNYKYANSNDKVDRMQGAYHMMKTGSGDCFNFYAVCSLFFERLGIPQISVVRSSNSGRGTKHFWSMVSLDGGATYYHFDSCPTTFFNANTCLLTDAELEKINQIAPGYFAMDPGIYPATPEELL